MGTILLCTKHAVPEEKCFLMIAIPFGLCMLLFLSGNGVYDAQAHLAKVYQYSNMLLGAGEEDSDNYTYMRYADAKVGIEKSGVINEQAQEYWRTLKDWEWFNGQNGMKQSSFHGAATGGTILGYLPNVIGMTVGRILDLGTYPMLYLSKIFGFVVYLSICYWAIKKTPILKTAFAFTAALPMSLYNATGITYDTMTIAATLLMCSYIFIWWERKLSKIEGGILCIAILFVGGCKGGVFLPLILLLFAVSWSKFRFSLKRTIIIVTMLGLAAGGFIYKYFDILRNALQVAIVSDNPEAKYGAGYCFAYPLSFIKMMTRSIIIRGDAYLGQLIGDRTAWTRAHIEWVIIIPFIVLLIVSGIRKDNEVDLLSNKRKWLIRFLLAAEFVGMHIILMSDTKVGSDYIYGVQGRYFIALIPLGILSFRENIIYRSQKSIYKMYFLYSIIQFIYMFSLLDKFL